MKYSSSEVEETSTSEAEEDLVMTVEVLGAVVVCNSLEGFPCGILSKLSLDKSVTWSTDVVGDLFSVKFVC